jgi:hypothetical protein
MDGSTAIMAARLALIVAMTTASAAACRTTLQAEGDDDPRTGPPAASGGGTGTTNVAVDSGASDPAGTAGRPEVTSGGGATGRQEGGSGRGGNAPSPPSSDAGSVVSAADASAAPRDAGTPQRPPQDLSTGLVAYWRFDEAAGASTAASVPMGRTGTLQGGLQRSADAPPVLPVAPSLSFDGVDDVAVLKDPNATITQTYTYSLWVRPSSTSAVSIILRTAEDGPLARWGEQLRITAAGQFEHHNTNVRNVTGTTIVRSGVWYHVAISGTVGGPMHLYVDGKEEGTPVMTPTIEDCDRRVQPRAHGGASRSTGQRATPGHAYIGSQFGQSFEGDLAELIAVRGPLSDDDLQNLESYLARKYRLSISRRRRAGRSKAPAA